MANNRMWVGCKVCHECRPFTKYYPSTGWYPVDNAEYKMSKFFEEHESKCMIENESYATMMHEEIFEFFYEAGMPITDYADKPSTYEPKSNET